MAGNRTVLNFFNLIKKYPTSFAQQPHRLFARCNSTDAKSASPDLNSYCRRSHHCGELRSSHVGHKVVLCGWLQFSRMNYFLTMQDAHGATQVILQNMDQKKILQDLHRESVIQVEGTVQQRPQGQSNPKMTTGEVEVIADSLKVLNPCQPGIPFHAHDFHQITEPLRMEYRYLALRHHRMQRNLRMRSQLLMKIREFLCNKHGFVDVETPTLFRKTPGGAREFVVPTHHPGKFYTMPQSPQQFKQLLMVGGLDRYMQIAKCFRDETGRPDRQPEFTQVDLEMSFVTAEDIKCLVEDLLAECWPEELDPIQTPFTRMTYKQAMETYGSDKPDIQFDMKLHDITTLVAGCQVTPLAEAADKHPDSSVQAVCFKSAAKTLSKRDMESLKKTAEQLNPNVWVALMRVKEGGEWQGGLAKALGPEIFQKLNSRLRPKSHDLIMVTAGRHMDACSLLGRLRVDVADILIDKGEQIEGISERKMNFLWVEDFPMFLPKEDGSGGLESAHHPFTAPHPEDAHLIHTHPEQVRSQHYDLVLNGNEVGGGSIRIHDSQLQRYILKNILQEETSSLEHLLEALELGAPPHGGIALGLDRLMAIICGTSSIRDVIAFPKSMEGRDPMSKAPAPISEEDKIYYHLNNTKTT